MDPTYVEFLATWNQIKLKGIWRQCAMCTLIPFLIWFSFRTKQLMKNVPLFLHFVADYMKSILKRTCVAFVRCKSWLREDYTHALVNYYWTSTKPASQHKQPNRSTEEKEKRESITQCKMHHVHVLLGRGMANGESPNDPGFWRDEKGGSGSST